MAIAMSDKEYVNEASDLVLDTVGVGSFILTSSVKNYLRVKRPLEVRGIITKYDLPFGLDELIDLSIEDLSKQKIIANDGRKIQRSCETRNINHRNNALTNRK